MNINIGLSSADIIDKAIEDIAIDIKLPPLPEQDKNIIAADVAENNYSNKINYEAIFKIISHHPIGWCDGIIQLWNN